ncbi:MAG TPA: GNAT family N-acetyltransferase [Alphaproteobacteria bacterium]|nr:GNAT family N-acetyltransferase [Alphaproteobacteria bacterium]
MIEDKSPPARGERIAPLAHHPQHVATVAHWLFAEWGLPAEGASLARTMALIRETLATDTIPMTLIALAGDSQALGTASLVVDDLGQGDPWTPWLASVFVTPAARGRGLGSRLVAAAEGEAARLGVGRLYLFTTDRERFYRRAGWEAIARRAHRQAAITIMSKLLVGSSPRG